MKHMILKSSLLLLCILSFNISCLAAINSGYSGTAPRRAAEFRTSSTLSNPPVIRTNTHSSISNQAHIMAPSITHTSVPTPGYPVHYNNIPLPQYNQGGIVINTYTSNPAMRYPVNNQIYSNGTSYQILNIPVTTTRTTTFTNANGTYTHTEEYIPNTGRFINRNRFLMW